MSELDAIFAQDAHVVSGFSDGHHTLGQNLDAAERAGLRALTCVENATRATDWLELYTASVRRLARTTGLRLGCAVRVGVLDTRGSLDLPAGVEGLDAVYITAHDVPTAHGPRDPAEVAELLIDGALAPDEVIQGIVFAIANALSRVESAVIAQPFAVLAQLGLSETSVAADLLELLADAAADRHAAIEINERWRCPSVRTLRPFVLRGVPLLLGTGSRRAETIGRYRHTRTVVAALRSEGLLRSRVAA